MTPMDLNKPDPEAERRRIIKGRNNALGLLLLERLGVQLTLQVRDLLLIMGPFERHFIEARLGDHDLRRCRGLPCRRLRGGGLLPTIRILGELLCIGGRARRRGSRWGSFLFRFRPQLCQFIGEEVGLRRCLHRRRNGRRRCSGDNLGLQCLCLAHFRLNLLHVSRCSRERPLRWAAPAALSLAAAD